MFGAQVSYVSRWRAGVTSSAHSSGYCSNCSELHDSKTTPMLQTQRRQRTCSYDDVKRMTSLNNMLTGGTSSQQPSVKNELNSSLEVSIVYWLIVGSSLIVYTFIYVYFSRCGLLAQTD